jgi:chaperonin GroES
MFKVRAGFHPRASGPRLHPRNSRNNRSKKLRNSAGKGKEISMKIRPLQDRVIVKRIAEEEKTKGGIIIPDTAKEKPQEVNDDGKLVALDVKVGDKILFGKYSGSEIKLNGEEHLIMREDDILGVVEG